MPGPEKGLRPFMVRSIKPYKSGFPTPIMFKNPAFNQINHFIKKISGSDIQ
jgi:hypothetical protein